MLPAQGAQLFNAALLGFQGMPVHLLPGSGNGQGLPGVTVYQPKKHEPDGDGFQHQKRQMPQHTIQPVGAFEQKKRLLQIDGQVQQRGSHRQSGIQGVGQRFGHTDQRQAQQAGDGAGGQTAQKEQRRDPQPAGIIRQGPGLVHDQQAEGRNHKTVQADGGEQYKQPPAPVAAKTEQQKEGQRQHHQADHQAGKTLPGTGDLPVKVRERLGAQQYQPVHHKQQPVAHPGAGRQHKTELVNAQKIGRNGGQPGQQDLLHRGTSLSSGCKVTR